MTNKIFTIFFAIALFTACNRDYMSLAKVNGDSISIGDFKTRLREIQFDPKLVAEDELMTLKRSILNEMIEDKLIEQESKKSYIRVSEDEVKSAINIEHLDETLKKQNIDKSHWQNRMKQKILAEKLFHEITKSVARPSETEVQEFFAKNEKAFDQQEQVRIQQIILPNREIAEAASKELASGTDFAAVAQKFIGDQDANMSLDLGFIPLGVLPENIEKKVFSLRVGQVSSVLESEGTFFIIKVLARKEDRPLLWEEARYEIETMLLQKAKETHYTKWLQDKTIEANIKRNYELLKENIHP
jgi:parvulin-like peptidyl-prolyl isomerase